MANRVNAESENGFWEGVAAAAGDPWQHEFELALGGAGGIREAAEASIRLFGLVAESVGDLLDEGERGIVDHELGAAGLSARLPG